MIRLGGKCVLLSELCQRRTYLYHREIFQHPHHVALCQNLFFWSDAQANDTKVNERLDEHCGPDHPLPDGSISWQVQFFLLSLINSKLFYLSLNVLLSQGLPANPQR